MRAKRPIFVGEECTRAFVVRVARASPISPPVTPPLRIDLNQRTLVVRMYAGELVDAHFSKCCAERHSAHERVANREQRKARDFVKHDRRDERAQKQDQHEGRGEAPRGRVRRANFIDKVLPSILGICRSVSLKAGICLIKS